MGSAYRGLPGDGSHWAVAQESFFSCYTGLGSVQFLKCLYVLVSLLFINIFFSCQVRQWLSCKEFHTLPKWWKASACDFVFPPPRSRYGSSRFARGTERMSASVLFQSTYSSGILSSSSAPTGLRAGRPGFQFQLRCLLRL